MLTVRGYVIADSDLSWRFSRASGPGGQHVNTTDTKVQLTFSVVNCEVFPEHLKQRLIERLGAEVVIIASEHRSQLQNRRAAGERLVARLEEALRPPPPQRRPTKPSRGAKQRRLNEKKRRGEVKQQRRRPHDD